MKSRSPFTEPLQLLEKMLARDPLSRLPPQLGLWVPGRWPCQGQHPTCPTLHILVLGGVENPALWFEFPLSAPQARSPTVGLGSLASLYRRHIIWSLKHSHRLQILASQLSCELFRVGAKFEALIDRS